MFTLLYAVSLLIRKKKISAPPLGLKTKLAPQALIIVFTSELRKTIKVPIYSRLLFYH